jgi:hypothetical protein
MCEKDRIILKRMDSNEWYFDCDDCYIDVIKDGATGSYSIYFRDRRDNSDAFVAQTVI